MFRRQFIEKAGAAVAAMCIGNVPTVYGRDEIPRRMLGKTGLNISLLTIGGHTFARRGVSENESLSIIRRSVDEGVNFFDNACCYNEGRSEELMGKALMNGYREKIFLMTKHHARDPENARKTLETSLRRLRTDWLDVWQFHDIKTLKEVDKIYTSGVLEFVLKMKEEGKVRFIGFTGHSNPEVHRQMIVRGFGWDTIQMPVNMLDHQYLSFSTQIIPMARERNIGIIGMKSLGGAPGVILKNNIASVPESLHFAMTLPVSTICSGIDSLEILKENIEITKRFSPLDQDRITALLRRTLKHSEGGAYETYKRTVF
jgi:predicted aldo/keto reductase-like oxidoreductase